MKISNWDDLRYLLALSRGQSLSGAARLLGVDQTTVSRRVRAIEEELGEQVFERQRAGQSLTMTGQALAQTAETMEQTLFDLERRAQGGQLELSGPLRLTLPSIMAHAWMPSLCEFATRHPRVIFEVIGSDAVHSLTKREADVALRFTEAPPEHLVGRRLAPLALAPYGATSLQDRAFEDLPWVGWEHAGHEVAMTESYRRTLSPDAPYSIWANSFLLLLDALREGMGVGILPCLAGDREPGLCRLGPTTPMTQHVWVLTHEDLRHNARVRALMSHLTQMVMEDKDALMGILDASTEAPE